MASKSQRAKLEYLRQRVLQLEQERNEDRTSFCQQMNDLRQKVTELGLKNQNLQGQLEESKQENIGLKEQIVSLKKEAEAKIRRFNEILDFFATGQQRDQLFDYLCDQYEVKWRIKQYEDALGLLFEILMIEESGHNDADRLGALWNNISCCWFALFRDEKALEAADKAIYCAPRDAFYYYTRGMLHKELRNRYDAIADFEKMLELDPGDQEAEDELAELQAQ